MTECVNYILKNGKFPDSLKNANITPFHKKDDPTDKVNYRPVSVLPLLSKIFEKVIYNQLGKYMDLFLNNYYVDLEKPILLNTLYLNYYSWKKELESSGFIDTILMDLSKAYDCLPHDLIIAKFEAYGLSKNSLT